MKSDLQYPIGKFSYHGPYTGAERSALIAQIENAPAEFRRAYEQLPPGGLDTPYRPAATGTAAQVEPLSRAR